MQQINLLKIKLYLLQKLQNFPQLKIRFYRHIFMIYQLLLHNNKLAKKLRKLNLFD